MLTANILGISPVKKGVFEGREYSNRYVHVMFVDPLDPIDGMKAAAVKVKSSVFDVFNFKVGEDVELNYDRFGNLFVTR